MRTSWLADQTFFCGLGAQVVVRAHVDEEVFPGADGLVLRVDIDIEDGFSGLRGLAFGLLGALRHGLHLGDGGDVADERVFVEEVEAGEDVAEVADLLVFFAVGAQEIGALVRRELGGAGVEVEERVDLFACVGE